MAETFKQNKSETNSVTQKLKEMLKFNGNIYIFNFWVHYIHAFWYKYQVILYYAQTYIPFGKN